MYLNKEVKVAKYLLLVFFFFFWSEFTGPLIP